MALSVPHYGMETRRIVLEGDQDYLLENPDVQEFYLGVAKGGGRKSFKEVKAYNRRKRFMQSTPCWPTHGGPKGPLGACPSAG